ncbi:MAG TPA: hypothetical protein VHH32_09140 [Gemmatimonadales bacterium]|nr:hypothetical protein [Gemmatimonadales bacterium]
MSEPPRETALQPEVHVRSVRRRRSDPPTPLTPPPVNPRNWMIYAGVVMVVLTLMLEGFLSHRPRQVLPGLSQATEVHSTLSELADSLRVVVSWDLTLSEPEGRPDSIRIRVVQTEPQQTVTVFQSSTQVADTVYLPMPPRGQTLSGVSCAAAEHPGPAGEESCTPWQYVRPSASPTGTVNEIVIRPAGLQVDPDVDGRCARWQEENPNRSVWIVVNQTAVPECTGPNKRPTVAQFCAFAVLPDGRRVKTANSINNSYCDELFEEWSRELYS